MGEIVRFKSARPQARHQGKTLCRSGFHKWEIVNDRPFDVKAGRLVTGYRCKRCGATRTEAR
jgi:hypothetical protein